MSETEVVTEVAVPVKKKGKRQIADGLAHIHASFNNTIITITDRQRERYHSQLTRRLQSFDWSAASVHTFQQ